MKRLLAFAILILALLSVEVGAFGALVPGQGFFGGRFNPKGIPGLQLWLDGSDSSTLFQDSALTTAAADDSDPVGGITDKSGNGNHLTQATASARATLKLSIINSRNVLRFDGVDDTLTKTASSILKNKTAATIVAVVRPANITVGRKGIASVAIAVGSSSRASLFANNAAGQLEAGGRRLDGEAFASVAASSAFIANQSTVVLGVFDYANSDLFLYQDGVLKNSSTSFQTDGSTSNTDSIVSIGSQSTTFLACDIGEMLLWERVLTATEISQLSAYLRTKWGTP